MCEIPCGSKKTSLSWQQLFYEVQADDQKRGKQVSRRFPCALRRDEQIIDGVEANAGAENAHSAGRCQPTAAKDIRNTEAGKNAAEKMQRPGGDPADQQKVNFSAYLEPTSLQLVSNRRCKLMVFHFRAAGPTPGIMDMHV